MKKRALLWSAVGFLLFAFCARLSAAERQRNSWYIGFGLGSGFDAAIGDEEEDYDIKDWMAGFDTISPKISIDFKVGRTLSPNLLLGFDITAVAQIGGDTSSVWHLQINNYFAMLTYFPFQKGLFIRGGGGPSLLISILSSSSDSSTDFYYGGGFLAGVGYAFWLGKRFNLTLNLDHSRQLYVVPSDGPGLSRFTIVYIGFDWY